VYESGDHPLAADKKPIHPLIDPGLAFLRFLPRFAMRNALFHFLRRKFDRYLIKAPPADWGLPPRPAATLTAK